MIHLEEITDQNWRQEFSVKPSQSGYVASYYKILAKAYAYRNARSSALLILNEETPVGFCMYNDLDQFEEYQLSQITIDARYQGQGFGTEAVTQILCHMKQDGRYRKVCLGCVAGNEVAFHLYQKLGFREIDREDDEIILELKL